MGFGLYFIIFVLAPLLALPVAVKGYRYGSASNKLWDAPPKDACDKTARKIVGVFAFVGYGALAYPLILFVLFTFLICFGVMLSVVSGS